MLIVDDPVLRQSSNCTGRNELVGNKEDGPIALATFVPGLTEIEHKNAILARLASITPLVAIVAGGRRLLIVAGRVRRRSSCIGDLPSREQHQCGDNYSKQREITRLLIQVIPG